LWLPCWIRFDCGLTLFTLRRVCSQFPAGVSSYCLLRLIPFLRYLCSFSAAPSSDCAPTIPTFRLICSVFAGFSSDCFPVFSFYGGNAVFSFCGFLRAFSADVDRAPTIYLPPGISARSSCWISCPASPSARRCMASPVRRPRTSCSESWACCASGGSADSPASSQSENLSFVVTTNQPASNHCTRDFYLPRCRSGGFHGGCQIFTSVDYL
jgi:hypothetical protein